MTLRDTIIGIADTSQTKNIQVPEWKGTKDKLALRELSQFEYDKLDFTKPGGEARLVTAALVGRDGTRVFADGDVTLVGAKNAMVITRISNAWFRWQRTLIDSVADEKKE
jgi:hypothetical protein